MNIALQTQPPALSDYSPKFGCNEEIDEPSSRLRLKLGRSWRLYDPTKGFRAVLAGGGFQDPQYFCDRLGVLMGAVARRDNVFALRAGDM